MKKQSPKQPAKRKAKRPAPVGNGETAQGAPSQAANQSGGNADAAQGKPETAQGTAGDYYRKQIGAFIARLKTDCEYICDTVRESLYNDGAGLLEDERIRAPLGRIAYIDNFVRYFGAWLDFTDCAVFLSELAPDNLTVAGGVMDLRKIERIPSVDTELLKDILDAGDDKTSLHNLTLYLFALWVNYHVGAVVAMFQKWVKVYGENVPAVLRDTTELARCVCVYSRTIDNSVGGIFYDGSGLRLLQFAGKRDRARRQIGTRRRRVNHCTASRTRRRARRTRPAF